MKIKLCFGENFNIQDYRRAFISLSLYREDIKFDINFEILNENNSELLFSTTSKVKSILNGKKKLTSSLKNKFLRENNKFFIEFDYSTYILNVFVDTELNKFKMPIISANIPSSGNLVKDERRNKSKFSIFINQSSFIEDQKGGFWNLYINNDKTTSTLYLEKKSDSVFILDYKNINNENNDLFFEYNNEKLNNLKIKIQKLNELRKNFKEKNSEINTFNINLNRREQRKENMKNIIELNRRKIENTNLDLEYDNKRIYLFLNYFKKLKIYINLAYSKYFNTYLSSFYPLISFYIFLLFLFIVKQNVVFSLIAYIPFLITIFSKTENIIERLNRSYYEERIKGYLNQGAFIYKYLNLILPLIIIIPINIINIPFILSLAISYCYLFLALNSIRENIISYHDGKIFFRVIYPVLMLGLLSELGFSYVNYFFIGALLCFIVFIFNLIQIFRLKNN